MSGVVLYSPEEARRNTFSVTKFHTLLGAELHTPDYDGPADFVINRTNDPAVARRFESQGVRVFNPAAFCAWPTIRTPAIALWRQRAWRSYPSTKRTRLWW